MQFGKYIYYTVEKWARTFQGTIEKNCKIGRKRNDQHELHKHVYMCTIHFSVVHISIITTSIHAKQS